MKTWRGQPDHNYWRLMPQTGRSRATQLWSVSAGLVVWAGLIWLDPPAPPYQRKLRWLSSWVASTIGWKWFVVLLVGIAGAIAICGVRAWRAGVRDEKRRAG